ncbi:MAG: exonuclease domain-containing protein [Gammaproteobacteria bacterium]
MFGLFRSLDARRRHALKHCPPGPLHDYLAVAFPDPRGDVRQAPFLALDLETTGLDPEKHEIVSMGWVGLDGLRIRLDSARHHLIRPARDLTPQSVVVHRITDEQAARGEALEVVLAVLLADLAGRVLIAHHAGIEVGFLRAACRRLYGGEFVVPVADTLLLARRRLSRRSQPPREGELRLSALHQAHNMPAHPAHDALGDALAAAEVFLAETAELGAMQGLALKRVLAR